MIEQSRVYDPEMGQWFEPTGAWHPPKMGEVFINKAGQVQTAQCDMYAGPRTILTPCDPPKAWLLGEAVLAMMSPEARARATGEIRHIVIGEYFWDWFLTTPVIKQCDFGTSFRYPVLSPPEPEPAGTERDNLLAAYEAIKAAEAILITAMDKAQ